jgi:D-alanyl-D-alanine carboxypeptidase
MADVRIGNRRLGSHNGLLRTYDGADGIKTGFICDAGYNVVASATREGRRLVAVVLGEPSGHDRTIRAASLLDHGFQVQQWKQMFATLTIETMAREPDNRGPISVRETVLSWDCGGRARARAVARARAEERKQKAAEKAKATPKAAAAEKAQPTSAAPTTAATTEKGAPKPKSAAAPSSPQTKNP